MPLDPYASCQCGSGKKFKWCCQPIHVEIDRAYTQDAEGQHDTALRIMDEVTRANPTNPEAWGRLAHLLYQNDRVEDAENALQKAFDINPNYPFGLLLRGLFRYQEDEWPGALLLFRRAADAYDPAASDSLAQVYELIGDCEMKLNRPVAARAALQISLHLRPDNEELRQGFDAYLGSESRLPLSARQDCSFRAPALTVSSNRRAAWDQALTNASGRLSEPARIFAQLTQDDPNDAAAWYNLAVARAWLGDNLGGLEALDRYVELEPDEVRAEAAWALGEVLRLADGMEELADHLEHSVTYQIRDPRAVFGLIQTWDREGRLVGVQADQAQGILTGLVMEEVGGIVTGTKGGERPLRVASSLLVLRDRLQLRHANREQIDRVRKELEQRAGPGLSAGVERSGHAHFGDVVQDALILVAGLEDKDAIEQRSRDFAARFYEETWIHRPLKSLNRIAPVDAAGHRVLRKKLRGVIRFIEECAIGGLLSVYDFNGLRHRLGLDAPMAAPAAAVPAGIASMSAADLSALSAETLPDDQLELAWQSAMKLDAQEQASRFAKQLATRPVAAERPDRGPLYWYLIQRSLGEGNTDEALGYVDEGERIDCERNEGRRRNEYELRRGQIHSKRGEADRAFEVFEGLLKRDPANQKARVVATEAMLSLRQGARALQLAQEGVAAARKLKDRDSEQAFLELSAAAKKQGG